MPDAILTQWRDALSTTVMDEVFESLFWAGIRYALPPVNIPALAKAVDLYRCDHGIPANVDYLSAIAALPVSRQEVKSVAGSHPLYFAMTHPGSGCYQHESAFHQATRRVLSRYFSTIAHSDRAESDADILRSDTQQCRDILRALADIGTPAPPDESQLYRYMLEQIQLRVGSRVIDHPFGK